MTTLLEVVGVAWVRPKLLVRHMSNMNHMFGMCHTYIHVYDRLLGD